MADVDQVFGGCVDGSMRRRSGSGHRRTGARTVSPAGRMIARVFIRTGEGYTPIVGLSVRHSDRRLGRTSPTTGSIYGSADPGRRPSGRLILPRLLFLGDLRAGGPATTWRIHRPLGLEDSRSVVRLPRLLETISAQPVARRAYPPIAYPCNKSGDRSRVMVAAADGSDPHPSATSTGSTRNGRLMLVTC